MYSLNLLPSLGYHLKEDEDGQIIDQNLDINFMGLITESDELNILDAKAIQQLIKFKWIRFAKNFHLFGCIMYFLYILALIAYTKVIYIDHLGEENEKEYYVMILGSGIFYPVFYEMFQLCKMGPIAHYSQIWNWNDTIFIGCGLGNMYSQY